MSSRFDRIIPRIAFLVVVTVLTTATVTLAAHWRGTTPTPSPAPVARPGVLVVPDVRGQAYVFAKGVLEDAGLAWRLGQGAPGYAGYRVVSQVPAAGTRVIDTGAPTIVLHIARDALYSAQGHAPQSESPYAGTAILLADTVSPAAPTTPAKPKLKPKPTPTKPATAPRAKPAATPKAKPAATAKAPVRTPAFIVAGAPKEPLDEITLPARAQQLETWVTAHTSPSTPNVHRWLYQHAWIVTGARFGWWHGVQALDVLIRVDQTVERQWEMGWKSEAEARQARSFAASHSR
jgi:PASTA domain-containing protein